MGPGVKEDKTLTKQGSKCFRLSTIFLLLNIGNFVVPVTGFALRNCRISDKNAICTPIKNSPKLKAVPRDIPPTVTGFDLSHNSISKIQVSDFKNLPVLTTLSLQANHILQIDYGAFADLISLRRLNLNGNNLQELSADVFHGLRNLTELRISSNRMKVVASTSFESLTSLTFLDISYNNLKNLTKLHSILQHLPNLQTLLVKGNNLVTFQSWELTNSSLKLTSLDLSQNPLEVFRITSDVFPKLTWFSIGGTPKKKQTTWDVRNKTFISRVSTLDISGLCMAREDMKTLLESVNSSLTSLRMDAMTYLPPLISISCTVPTMSSLKLRHNELRFVRPDLFKLCINITEIDLSQNKIKNISDIAFRHIPGLRILSLSRNKLSSVPVATRNLPFLAELDLSTNNISTLGCDDFANLTKLRQLNLYQNSISFLKDCVFKDLGQLQVLKLQNNSISKLGNVFTTKHLSNLRQLHLNQNKLQVITMGTFEGLQSLQNLSLHDNQIQELQKGCFRGLTNLTTILLQTNKLDEKKINTGALNDLINLQRLDMRNNKIKYQYSTPLDAPPFSNLSRLEILAMPAQRRRGKSQLPSNILQGLTNLKVFNTRNIQLLSLPKDIFKYTPNLHTLDISSNIIVDLSPDLFSPIQNLTSLYISRTSLRSLDFLINANLTKLEHMQARWNAFSVMNKDVIKALPALIYVDFQGNSFTCDCDNAWFLQWITNDKQTQVFDAYNFKCNYPPDLNGRKLLKFDVQSCSVYDFICFVSTTCMILLVMVVSFTYHFLRGQLAYAYYLFLAWLFDSRHRNKQAPNQYDAFISYNTHDEPWVIRQLLPKLEGEQGWRLCLHHRDFEPGKPIIDNITDAIYGSRKTICVITRRYLESEWCSKEIQVASFRLFDEQKDVLILLLLEDIPTSQLSPYYRMRKLLKRQTYLSWPQAGEHTELFWEKLRQALNTREDLSEDRLHLNIMG